MEHLSNICQLICLMIVSLKISLKFQNKMIIRIRINEYYIEHIDMGTVSVYVFIQRQLVVPRIDNCPRSCSEKFWRHNSKMLVRLNVRTQTSWWVWTSEVKDVGDFGCHKSKMFMRLEVRTQTSWWVWTS